MDGIELELICPCGFENFERIVVQRKPHAPIVTDFVACVGCRTMYWAPDPPPLPPERLVGHGVQAIGGPESRPDSAEALKRDAADAAKDYVKPGRPGPRRA
jgi:hypothetical protein